MIVCDPYTVNTLVHSVFRQLQVLANRKGQFPKRNDDTLLLLRLLTLGISAWEIIDKQNFKEPKVDPKIISNFCPSLLCLFVDDLIKPVEDNVEKMNKLIDPAGMLKLEASKKSEQVSDSIYSEEIPAAFTEGIENSKIAVHIAGAYLNHLARTKNQLALLRVLNSVIQADTKLPYSDMFQHQFIFSLAGMAENFRNDAKFRNFIFEQYLLPKTKKDSVLRHSLRLLFLLQRKLTRNVFDDLCNQFKPPEKCSQITDELYRKLFL